MRRIDLKRIHTAHFGTMRAINRQIVLNYVRDRGPISRAEIARRTKLQRSTISEIVDSLLEEGLIEEVGSGQSTGGRCPTLLALRTTGAAAIGIDIAPTRTTLATSDLAGGLLESKEFETDHDFERTVARAVAAAGRLIERGGGSIEGIGVSLPGLGDSSKGRLLYVPYFKWQDLDVSGPIAEATGLKVTIDNDANAAALAALWVRRARRALFRPRRRERGPRLHNGLHSRGRRRGDNLRRPSLPRRGRRGGRVRPHDNRRPRARALLVRQLRLLGGFRVGARGRRGRRAPSGREHRARDE